MNLPAADVGCQNIFADQALLDTERETPTFRAKVSLGFEEEAAVFVLRILDDEVGRPSSGDEGN